MIERLDLNLVMAEQSLHDVVNQPQSADAPSSVDVSAVTNLDPATRVAAEHQLTRADDESTIPAAPINDMIEPLLKHSANAATESSVDNVVDASVYFLCLERSGTFLTLH